MMKEIIKLIKDQIEFDKTFEERNISPVIQFKASNSYSLFPYHQPAAYGDNFSNVTFIHSPYHLDVSWPHRAIGHDR